MRYGVNVERHMSCDRLTLISRGVCAVVKEGHITRGRFYSDNHVLNVVSTRVEYQIEPRFLLERNCTTEKNISFG
jgi:hypothetical protein